MNATSRNRIVESVNDLLRSVSALLDSLASVAKDGGAARSRRGGARGEWTPQRRAKLRRSIASYWSSLTPAQHSARVKKMLAGRGLEPKRRARKSAPK